MSIEPAAHGAIMFYSVDIYGKFNLLTYEQCGEAAEAAMKASLGYPLFSRDKNGNFPEFDIPHFGKRSSVYCAAIMSAWLVWLVWLHCVIAKSESSLPESELLSAAKDGLALWKKEDLAEHWKKGAKSA